MTTWHDDAGQEAGGPGGSVSMACTAFEAALPDYLDGSLSPDAVSAATTHLAACAQCRRLTGDLEQLAARAAALPSLRPERDLWPEIDVRIAAPTIPLRAPGRVESGLAPGLAHRPTGARWSAWTVAVAAGLVMAASGLTFAATRWWEMSTGGVIGGQRPGVVAQRAPSSPDNRSGAGLTPATVAVSPAASGPAGSATSAGASPPAVVAVRDGGALRRSAPTSEFIYDTQITALRQILQQRRGRLDPKTVAIIEKNLRVIDAAITESRAALVRDPANAFLARQLDESLDTKVELLRMVALLPART